MALDPAQRKLPALLDHIAQAARELELPTPRDDSRLDRQKPALSHARDDEPVHQPTPLLSV